MKTILTIASIIFLLLALQAGLEFFETNYSQLQTKETSSERENVNEAIVRFSMYTQKNQGKNQQSYDHQPFQTFQAQSLCSLPVSKIELYIMYHSLLI
ncbi:MAG: hypothetical protein ACJA2S_001863 [Cyclobacteriaceae bacterium]|jgi:hypothetical protein